MPAKAKSAASLRNVIRHVQGLVKFYIDNIVDTKIELTGDQSDVLLRDCLESLVGRGRAVPVAAKSALSVWADALWIDWPLTSKLACSSAVVGSNECPKQAQSTKLSALRAID